MAVKGFLARLWAPRQRPSDGADQFDFAGKQRMTTGSQRPVVLCILDGFGYREEDNDNAIALAHTPTWDRFLTDYPSAMIETSGLAVGLPAGQMGNSEVGHMNIGAGRVVMQELPRIDAAIASGDLARNTALLAFMATLKKTGGTAHLMGLLSPGGVHSHQSHMAALAAIMAEAGIPVAVHAFLDGRDTPPRSAKGFVETFLRDTREVPGLTMATLGGRYYAMDRDNRWDRVALAYAAMVNAGGQRFPNPLSAIEASYSQDIGDEFVKPLIIGDYAGMKAGDGVLMANFRADRAREITQCLLDPDFTGFERGRVVPMAAAAGLLEYSTAHRAWLTTLFAAESFKNTLGAVVAGAGLRQLRIAETEKYAHVTFFFNGGEEKPCVGEERLLIPSPKVATYDLDPAMSAETVTANLERVIAAGTYDLIVVNYANGDMVGHTGVLSAAIAAVETLDGALARLEKVVHAVGGVMLVTADHGNCEMMRDPDTGEPYTQHTVGKVWAVLVNPPQTIGPLTVGWLHDGILADIAPTLLALLGLPQPPEMTGKVLFDTVHAGRETDVR